MLSIITKENEVISAKSTPPLTIVFKKSKGLEKNDVELITTILSIFNYINLKVCFVTID
jgi:hypothetical protein